MKKSLIRLALMLSLVAASSGSAQAFGLLPGFGCLGCGCNKYANIMICKPYNAFDSFCSGITYGNCCAPRCCPTPCPMPCPTPCAAPCAPAACPAPCADACSPSAYRGMPMQNMAWGYGGGYYPYGQTVPVGYYGYYGYPMNAGYVAPSYNPYPVQPVSYMPMPYYWAR